MQTIRRLANPTGESPDKTPGAFTDDLLGYTIEYEHGDINDEGGYGYPHTDDTRPDFVKEDERGWVRLLRWLI
jgi:hypothetical protein